MKLVCRLMGKGMDSYVAVVENGRIVKLSLDDVIRLCKEKKNLKSALYSKYDAA